MQIIKKLFYEPLLHFLIFGALIYFYYAQQNTTTQTNITTIQISPYEIQEIESQYKNLSQQSKNILIKKLYYDKVLLNEAYALKLDKQNKDIQNILLQKIKQIIASSKQLPEPTQEQLHQYYEKHQNDYKETQALSFTQIAFNNKQDAQKYLEIFRTLEVTTKEAPFFNTISTFTTTFQDITYKEVREKFGNYFALKIFRMPKNIWLGTLRSKSAQHLLYISAKKTTTLLSFDEVQDRVYEDYLLFSRKQIYKDAFMKILQQYQLKVQH